MLDTGLMLAAARSLRVPTQRVGTRKGWPRPKPCRRDTCATSCRRDACATAGVTCYDTLPVGKGVKYADCAVWQYKCRAQAEFPPASGQAWPFVHPARPV